jgi:hypothetical protein
MIKDIGGEAIMKVAVPRTDAHLSLYPRGDSMRHHVTHEVYPKGHGRRHTQKKEVDLLRIVNAMLQMIAPRDDPPPGIASLCEINSKELEGWAERAFPRLFHPPTDRLLKRFKGPLGDLYDAIFQSSDAEVAIDFDPILESIDDMEEADLVETFRENELCRPGKFWGFSEDYSKFVVFVDRNTVGEFDVESVCSFGEVIMEEMGFAGYMRTIDRKLTGRK